MKESNIIWKEMETKLAEGKATTLFAWPNPNDFTEVYYEIYGIEGKTKEQAKMEIMKKIEQKRKSKK